MNPLVLPPDEKEMGLLPSLPPFETVIEWATWMTLWVGVGGMTCLLMGWAVLRWRSRSVGWLAGAQWANRLALITWCLGLMIAVAAPPFLVVVIPALCLHGLTLSRLRRARFREERPPYPRLRLIFSSDWKNKASAE